MDGDTSRAAPAPEPTLESVPQPDRYVDPPAFHVAAQEHEFTFLPSGADRLAGLLEMIETAQHSLALFYYMFDDDASGAKVRDALVAAALRGVTVDLIVDAFGKDSRRSFFDPLVEAGGRFALFSSRWGTGYFIRNHQKLVIADGCRAMTGGANVSDHYFAPPAANGWCDLAVIIEGPVVARFGEWFALVAAWVADDLPGESGQLLSLREMVKQWDCGEGPVQLLVGGPLVRRGHWAWQFRKDILRARRLDAVSAYFSPPRSLRQEIAKLARRGRVRLILAGKSDIGAAIDMARLLYRKLLAAGVRILEFGACKLHMKLLVVDDVSYVGSANLDKRSLRINVELMVRIADPEVAAILRRLIDHLESGSETITPHRYAQQATFLARLRWRLTYLLSLADYRVSRLSAR